MRNKLVLWVLAWIAVITFGGAYLSSGCNLDSTIPAGTPDGNDIGECVLDSSALDNCVLAL